MICGGRAGALPPHREVAANEPIGAYEVASASIAAASASMAM